MFSIFSLNPRRRQRPTRSPFRPRLERLEDRLTPATLFVNTHQDLLTSNPGVLSLREAIGIANAATTPDTIVLQSGLYKINPGILDDANFLITNSMTIEGQGPGSTTVDGAGAGIFTLGAPLINVTFEDMSLRHGAVGIYAVNTANIRVVACQVSDNGGGIIDNSGNVTVIDSTVSRNVSNGNGGGIDLGGGNLYLTGSVVRRNLAAGDGGGIYDTGTGTGTVTLTDSTVSDNQSSTSGGGIYAGTVNLKGSTVDDNSARTDGGGIDATGTATLTNNSTVSDNSAGHFGGGIDASSANLTRSTVSGNTARDSGGGIYAAYVSLTNCTVDDNNGGNGGGIDTPGGTLTDCTVSANSAGLGGGGIYGNNEGGTLTVTDSTVSDNSAAGQGGGIDDIGILALSDSTVSGNSAIGNGGGINANYLTLVGSTLSGNNDNANGGGAYAGRLVAANSTISGNSARADGGGILMADVTTLLFDTITENTAGNGGGICRAINGATQFVQDSIIALNRASFGGVGPDVDGGVLSDGNNVIGILDSAGDNSFTPGVNGDQVGSVAHPLAPGLGPLQNNGGPTQTYAILAGSPAINHGINEALSQAATVSAGQTTIQVTEDGNIAPGMVLQLGSELMLVLVVVDNGMDRTITVQRGFDGTADVAHINNDSPNSNLLFLATDQRGDPRPTNVTTGTAVCDIGAFQIRPFIGNAH
jgi:predicted outer membrane repeat protein